MVYGRALPTDRSDVQMCREVDGGGKLRGVRRLGGGEECFTPPPSTSAYPTTGDREMYRFECIVNTGEQH
jgi:hypothetical protein